MGLNDNIYTISKSIISERQERQKEREQKDVLADIKSKLKQLLLLELINAKKSNINIYLDEVKDYILKSVVSGYSNRLKKNFKNRFESTYKKASTQYLLLNYYTICSQAERISKKQQEDFASDYKKQIALEKWQLQRQKMQLQIAREKQKLSQKQQELSQKQQKISQKQQQEAEQHQNEKMTILLTIVKILIAPIWICALLLVGFVNGMANSK